MINNRKEESWHIPYNLIRFNLSNGIHLFFYFYNACTSAICKSHENCNKKVLHTVCFTSVKAEER